MKVVADTNVLVSGLLWTGLPHKLLELAENKYITIYSSLPLIEELSKVLVRPKFIDRIEELKTTPEEFIESLLGLVEIVHPRKLINEIKIDKDDNRVLECAMEADADYIVSGDPHLIRLESFNDIPILIPRRLIGLIT